MGKDKFLNLCTGRSGSMAAINIYQRLASLSLDSFGDKVYFVRGRRSHQMYIIFISTLPYTNSKSQT